MKVFIVNVLCHHVVGFLMKNELLIRLLRGNVLSLRKNESYNHAQDPEERYAWFLDAWLGWVHAGSRRGKQKQPILEAKEKTA